MAQLSKNYTKYINIKIKDNVRSSSQETFITKYIFSTDHKMIAEAVFNNWYVYGFLLEC